MKKLITVVVNKMVIVTEEIEVNFPETPKFYFKNDDGNFFASGWMLFAIIPKHKNSYMLYEIQKNKQDSNDFVPTKDCKSEHWVNGGIRKTAFDIIVGKSYMWEWQEITEDAFLTIREDLLTLNLE